MACFLGRPKLQKLVETLLFGALKFDPPLSHFGLDFMLAPFPFFGEKPCPPLFQFWPDCTKSLVATETPTASI